MIEAPIEGLYRHHDSESVGLKRELLMHGRPECRTCRSLKALILCFASACRLSFAAPEDWPHQIDCLSLQTHFEIQIVQSRWLNAFPLHKSKGVDTIYIQPKQIRGVNQPPVRQTRDTHEYRRRVLCSQMYSTHTTMSGLPPMHPLSLLPLRLLSIHRRLAVPRFTQVSLARGLLSPLQHLGAHLNQPVLGLALGERRYRLDGLVDVVLCQGAGLLKAGGREYNFAGLEHRC